MRGTMERLEEGGYKDQRGADVLRWNPGGFKQSNQTYSHVAMVTAATGLLSPPPQKRSTIRMNVTPAKNENNNHSMWWVMEGRYYGDGGTRAACSQQGCRASGQLGLSTILLINKTPKD